MRKFNLGKKVFFGFVLIGLLFTQSINAQDKLSADISADIVSSYIWRGGKTADASVQPSLSVSYGDFSLGSWASTNLNGNSYKEVDFTASFEKSGFIAAVTDYWWDGEGALRYFSSPNADFSGHMLEGTLGYQLQGSFPFSLTWNTFFMGKGNKKENGDNSFSTYVELAYPFKIGSIDMGIATGFTPWESVIYGTDKFKFTSVQLHAAKSIKITDSFSLPIFGDIIANPHTEDIHFVFGITIE